MMSDFGAGYNTPGGMAGQDYRPPYVKYERRAVDKQKPAAEGGGVYYVDKDFAIITTAGSKNSVEKIVDEWWPQLEDQVRQGRFPPQWLDAYKKQYAAWNSGQELPVDGTPIVSWPAASAAEMKMMHALDIRSVEDLAVANEELLSKIGMGGRDLKKRAQDWVTAKTDTAPLIAQLSAMRGMLDGLETRLKDAEAKNTALESALNQRNYVIQTAQRDGAPPPPDFEAMRQNTAREEDAMITDVLKEELS
jgi:hypothetical protein